MILSFAVASLTQVDIFSIISSAISLVLGIVAIALSIVFFKMSDKSSKDAEKSANNIDSSVKKLEMLFEKLYSGTFDMMRETVTDMRKHAYSKDTQFIENNEKMYKEINEKIVAEVAASIQEIKSNQYNEEELQKIIMNVVRSSKQAEKDVKGNVVREEILSLIRVKGKTTYTKILEYLKEKNIGDPPIIFSEVKKLADDGKINNLFNYDEGIRETVISSNEDIYLL